MAIRNYIHLCIAVCVCELLCVDSRPCLTVNRPAELVTVDRIEGLTIANLVIGLGIFILLAVISTFVLILW